jgi:transcriptional regulator with XRE-family HTH domain
MLNQEFGQLIRRARKEKGYSQRELATLVKLDFTYLSKMENNRAEYAPKEDVIRRIAEHLGLDPEELIYLAGRIPHQEEALLSEYHKSMPMLFRRMRENPDFAQKIFKQAEAAE